MKAVKYLLILTLFFITISCSDSGRKTLSVICMGDSLTESGFGSYPIHLQKLFARKKIKTKTISLGRPGNTSGEYLHYLEQKTPLEELNPDIVILMLGTNDVRIDSDHTPTHRFRTNMLKIIRIIRDHSKKKSIKTKIFIATIPPIFVSDLHTFSKESARRVHEEIVPSIQRISNEEKLDLVDINTFFYRNRDLLPGIHPSPSGYYKMAKFICNEVVKCIRPDSAE